MSAALSVPSRDGKKQPNEVVAQEIEHSNLRSTRNRYEPLTDDHRRLDKSVNRKLDLCLISVLMVDFMLQSIDKTNIGNVATTKTFVSDTHLQKNDVSDVVSLFSATFVTFQPIMTLLGRRIGPRIMIPISMLCWGILTTAQMALNGCEMLIAVRLLLGVFEAGFVPVAYYTIGTCYPRYMAGLRLGLFAGMFSISGAFASLIAYGIFQIQNSHYKDWQLLFMVQGIITLAFAMINAVVIPGKLSTYWIFTAEEREHAVYRLRADNADIDGTGHYQAEDGKISWKNIRDAALDFPKLALIAFNMLATIPVYGFTFFMPLIVQGMGYTGTRSNLMAVSPFVVGGIGLVTIVYISDHYRDRSGFIVLSMLISIVGFIVLISSSDPKLRYAFVHVCMIGAGTANPLVAGWLRDNTPDRAVLAVFMGLFGLSNLAGIIAGQVYKVSYGPSYQFPLTITLILVSVGCAGFACVRVLFMLINRSRAKQISTWTEAQTDEERRLEVRRGHNKRIFIYGY